MVAPWGRLWLSRGLRLFPSAPTVMSTTAMVVERDKHLAPAPGTSEQAHYAGYAEHPRDRSQVHRLADCMRHPQDQQGSRQPIFNELDKAEITKRLDLVRTDLSGSMTPTARRNNHFVAKCSDHYTKFKTVYFSSSRQRTRR